MQQILVPLGLFASIFGVLYLFITARYRERMALIEKGLSADMFKTDGGVSNLNRRIGLLSIGVSLGIISGMICSKFNIGDDAIYPASIFFFGGIALLIAHYLDKKDKSKSDQISK